MTDPGISLIFSLILMCIAKNEYATADILNRRRKFVDYPH